MGCFETTIFDLSCSLSKLLFATTSPGLIPVTSVLFAFGDTRLHAALVRRIVLNHIDKRGGAVMLDRRRRNYRRALQRIHQQPCVDELVRK